MKSIFTKLTFSLMMVLCLGSTAFAVGTVSPTTEPGLSSLSFEDIANMSAKEVTEITGQELNFKQKLALKYVQHQMKKGSEKGSDEYDKVLIFVLCFFIPPLAVFLVYDIGSEFWVNLILTLLCGLPGIIHAFIVCSRYYK